ncbi:hypothetical protein MBLNU457_6003t2 [Dothideomycetes sp. NU457]
MQASGCGISDYYCQCTAGKQEITEYVYTCLMKSSCTNSDVQGINSAVAATCSSATATASSTAASSNTVGSAAVTHSTSQPVNSDATSPSGAPPLSLTGGHTGLTTRSSTSETTTSETASSTAAPPTPAASSHNGADTLRGMGMWLGLSGMVMAVL